MYLHKIAPTHPNRHKYTHTNTHISPKNTHNKTTNKMYSLIIESPKGPQMRKGPNWRFRLSIIREYVLYLCTHISVMCDLLWDHIPARYTPWEYNTTKPQTKSILWFIESLNRQLGPFRFWAFLLLMYIHPRYRCIYILCTDVYTSSPHVFIPTVYILLVHDVGAGHTSQKCVCTDI